LLDAFQEIPQMLLTQTEDQVLDRLTELACNLVNAPASAIWLFDGDEVELRACTWTLERGSRLPVNAEPFLTVSLENKVRFLERDSSTLSSKVGPENDPDWKYAWLSPFTAGPEKEPAGVFCVYLSSEIAGLGGADWEQKVLEMLSHFAGMGLFYASHQEALRKAQEQRAVAEMFAAVGDLATNLLHQLNNKVGTIPVRVQGIQDKCAALLANDRYLANNLAEIERSASEAMVAVRQNLSHLHPVQMVPVNLADCVQEAIETASTGPGINVQMVGLSALTLLAGSRT
jgi:hypothetical protein